MWRMQTKHFLSSYLSNQLSLIHWLVGVIVLFGWLDANAATQMAGINPDLTLNPTVGDVSLVFLSNIFGSVDGVLTGTGSQIIGEMFGVFNSAVLSIGGIMLLYTTIVSTTQTAHKGQLLGAKWSAIWVPLRSTVGVGLILPKASGYCTIQIIFMWMITQGIGAADNLWSTALNYLNSGGSIVSEQISPNTSANADSGKVMDASMGILAAQVCMSVVEKEFKSLRSSELDKQKNAASGNCELYKNDTDSDWYKFCNQDVPDFNNTVNFVSEDNMAASADTGLTVYFPNFETDSPYFKLKGICGQISWTTYTPTTSGNLTADSVDALKNSRTVAMGQLYEGLRTVSDEMINNVPIYNQLTVQCSTADPSCINDTYTIYAYGQALDQDLGANAKYCQGRAGNCTDVKSGTCTTWGDGDGNSVIFSGTELQNAVAAYNGIMSRATAMKNLTNSDSSAYENLREFIPEAKSNGWLMAGAYFFRLAILNSYVIQSRNNDNATDDTDSGISFQNGAPSSSNSGNWSLNTIKLALRPENNQDCKLSNTTPSPFCGLPVSATNHLCSLIGGKSDCSEALPTHSDACPVPTVNNGVIYNNTFTYLKNANALQLPGQSTILDAGFKTWQISFNPNTAVPELGNQSFSGGKFDIPGVALTFFWNFVIKPLWNMLLQLMMPPILELFSAILTPMIGMTAAIFNQALDVMRIPGANPIIALANLGTRLIDGIGDAWIYIIVYATPALLFPPAYALIMCLMPVIFSWMGIMLTVGFSAAFYVPFVPLLVFTFAGIGWMIGVIEAMVAAPLVGLGVIKPNGHEMFGKSEQAIMLILGIFLRPSLMIMGYIFGIILSYVGIWFMNQGFNQVVPEFRGLSKLSGNQITPSIIPVSDLVQDADDSMYGFWSSIFLFYFCILIYIATYIAIVTKAFNMIFYLPDKVLRWLSGGVVEQLGEGAASGMMQDVKGRSDQAGAQSSKAMAKVQSGLISKASASMPNLNDKDKDKDEDDDQSKSEDGDGEDGGEAPVE